MPRPHRIALLALAGVPLLAACGDEGTAPAPVQRAAAAPPALVVDLTASQFSPASVRARVGEQITFVNRDAIAHTATATSGARIRLRGHGTGRALHLHAAENRPGLPRLRDSPWYDRVNSGVIRYTRPILARRLLTWCPELHLLPGCPSAAPPDDLSSAFQQAELLCCARSAARRSGSTIRTPPTRPTRSRRRSGARRARPPTTRSTTSSSARRSRSPAASSASTGCRPRSASGTLRRPSATTGTARASAASASSRRSSTS